MTELAPGDPDGHGQYAQLTMSEDGELVLCHECGLWKRTVGTHAWYAHGLTAVEYRARHGLMTGLRLAAPATQQRLRETEQQTSGAALRRLEASRDPDLARLAITPEGQRRPQRKQVRQATAATARLGRPLTEAEADRLAAAVSIDAWAALAQQLVDSGVRQAEISRRTGIPSPTVSQRLRRRRPGTIEPAVPQERRSPRRPPG